MDSRGRPSVEQLAEWFLERVRRGEQPSIAEYTQRYPELAADIREAFSALAFVEQFAPRPAELARSIARDLRLGDFRIVREVGRGGMGVVYEAVQESLGRHVALKVMSPRESSHGASAERFHREARVAARLHHSNLVPVFDVGEHEGVLYYAMQFIQGASLDKVLLELRRMRHAQRPIDSGGGAGLSRELADSLWTGPPRASPVDSSDRSADHDAPRRTVPRGAGPADVDDSAISAASTLLGTADVAPSRAQPSRRHYDRNVARLGLQVAEGLDYLHGQGLLHRDIKPSNLLLDTRGVVWITDLGLVHDDEAEALTRTGDVVGTLRYMGPERLRGQAYPSSDVYGLGVTLYEMLTLQAAFPPERRGELAQQITSVDPPRPRRLAPELARDLETIVLKAIDKDPRQRYQTAGAMATDLRCFLEDRPIAARRAGAPERVWRWCRRNPGFAALVGSVAALLLVLAAGSSLAALLFRAQARDLRIERSNATRRLYDAFVAQAQARRWSRRPGQRLDSLRALADAARLLPQLEGGDPQRVTLRNEAIACLALRDVRLPESLTSTPRGGKIIGFDERLERYAWSDAEGAVAVCRVSDESEILRLPGPGFRAHVAQFSANGRHVAVKYEGPDGPVAKVWDLERLAAAVERPDGEAFDFDPGGRIVAVALRDGAIHLASLDASEPERRFESAESPTSIRFHPTQPRLAVASDSDAFVTLLDSSSGSVVARLEHPDVVLDLSWSPEGRLLACASGDYRTYVWDTQINERRSILTGHQAEVTHVAFDHSGDLLATYAWDGTTRLWDPTSGQELLRLPGWFRQFGPDDRRLALVPAESMAHVDSFGICEIAAANEFRVVHETGQGKGPRTVAISSDGRLAASSGADGMRLWDWPSGREIARFCGDDETALGPASVWFQAGGDALWTSSQSGLRRWPLDRSPQDGATRIGLGPPERIAEVAPTRRACPDRSGRFVAAIRGNRAHLVDLEQHSVVAQTGAHPQLSHLALDPQARWIATGTWHGTGAKVWDAATGREIRDLWPDAVNAVVAFHPDGRSLAVGADDSYRFFSTGTWTQTLEVPGSTPHTMAFSADGQLLALAHSRHAVRLVDAATGQAWALLEAPSPQPIAGLCFSPDGGGLAVACLSHVIQVWDLRRIRRRLADMGLDWPRPDAAPWAADDVSSIPGGRVVGAAPTPSHPSPR